MLRRALLAALALVGAAAPLVAPAAAGDRSDARDRMLYERAVRVGRNVATRHLTPEGLLAYAHRRNATAAQLSHDCLRNADTGIWSGCYAASLACRYAVTRDPEALALARRAAAGLDLLSAVTGVEGALSRAAGRPIPGEDLAPHVRPSPALPGFSFRDDPSRDTLSGIVLGWECLARFVDDAEVRMYAAKNLGAIARRLYQGGMKVRDADGDTTKHGALDAKVALFIPIGSHAAIGSAAVLAGARWSAAEDLWAAWRKLCDQGWDDAVDKQYTWVGGKAMSASNVNMAHLALLVLALEDEGKAKRGAMAALREFRRATRGWHNGGLLSMALLAGQGVGRDESVEELRETLLTLPAEEVERSGTRVVHGARLVPLERRPLSVWTWKSSPFDEEDGRESAVESDRTFTRADFLFAYWLARAAGELDPGAAPVLPPTAAPAPPPPPLPVPPTR